VPCIGTSTSSAAASHVKLFYFDQGTSSTGITSPTGAQHIHDKLFIIYGNFAGTHEFRVYTGSHNLGSTANDTNEELFVRLASEPAGDVSLRPVYNAYYDHFYDAYDSGTLLTGPTSGTPVDN
jgi:hypothetical protein